MIEGVLKMQSLKKKSSSSGNGNTGQELPKQKERHIVSWLQEEDDILREQIRVHGTVNWAIIASKFKDKSTRQCRRRWFTYLNSDFKKGGWSPEEDLLLCEAQKIFGNRWTEIAKVVSGRTDNAVKNRFSTLCKKRAKYEALAKENNNTSSYINLNNKRVIFPIAISTDGTSDAAGALKKMRRSHIPNLSENRDSEGKSLGERGPATESLRSPFAVLVQNSHKNGRNLSTRQHVHNIKEKPADASNNKIQGTFLKKNDPKILALMQQAQLLSSLAAKVNSDNNTDQSLESAWKVLQDFLNQPKETDEVSFSISEMNLQLENIKDLIEDLRGSNDCSRPSWRQPDLYEDSSASSEYSTGSTLLPSNAQCDKMEQIQSDICEEYQGTGPELRLTHADDLHVLVEGENEISCDQTTNQDILPACEEINSECLAACGFSDADYSSPLHETPLFRTIAATIPSPKFSESEKHFLLRALGMETTSADSNTYPSQPPACKRALLQSL